MSKPEAGTGSAASRMGGRRLLHLLASAALATISACGFVLLTPSALSADWSEACPAAVAASVSRIGIQTHLSNLFAHDEMCRGFSDGNPLRWPTNQHDAARDYITAVLLSNASFNVHTQVFWFNRTYSPYTYTYTNACNVIAFKPGTDPSAGFYIVGAHYDSVDTGHGHLVNSPGADDNGSGVAGLLELSRALDAFSFRSSIALVAFDAEEKGLYGSIAFVNAFTTAVSNEICTSVSNMWRGNIRGMISMDMIGYNPGGSNWARVYGGSSTPSPVKTNLAAAAARYGGIQAFDSGQNNASDHGPFYTTTPSVDSCVFIEYHHSSATNIYYHTVSDSLDRVGYIDHEFAARMTASVAGYLAEQAQVVPTVTVDAQDAVASEFSGDTASFAFSRNSTNGDLAVSYAVGGTATPDGDYSSLPGVVVISNGASNAFVAVVPLRDSSPEGDETVSVAVNPQPSYGVGAHATANAAIKDVPFDAWRHAHFTAEELTNSSASGDFADPDRDGAPNLLEYAAGSDPRSPAAVPILRPALISMWTGPAFVVYYSRRCGLADAALHLQTCGNLPEGIWTDASGFVEQTSVESNETYETIRAGFLDPLDDAPRLFVRLHAIRP